VFLFIPKIARLKTKEKEEEEEEEQRRLLLISLLCSLLSGFVVSVTYYLVEVRFGISSSSLLCFVLYKIAI